MESQEHGERSSETLPPPPPVIPPDVVPIRAVTEAQKSSKPKRMITSRPGMGRNGRTLELFTNHFKTDVKALDGYFYQYSVVFKYEDDTLATGIGDVQRRIIDKVLEIYHEDLGDKDIAYDGEKSLFTVGSLPQINHYFTVLIEQRLSTRTADAGNISPGKDDFDVKRRRMYLRLKTYKVELSFASKIPIQALANALRGYENEKSMEAIRVLDIILRQHAAKQGCLLVRQSFFRDNPRNFEDVGEGVLACKGFYSSFRAVQGGLSLNMDTSTTMIVRPGLVLDFLMWNQRVNNPSMIDWIKANRTLKGLRVKVITMNMEYKIAGLSKEPCNQLKFTLKRRKVDGGDGDDGIETMETTVYDYFMKIRNVHVKDSAYFPCVNVGKAKRPTYYPIELCSLVSLQRYKKALSSQQRANLVDKSRQKPQERMRLLNDSLRGADYNVDPMLKACGISIGNEFMQLEGRVLQPPKIKVGNNEDFIPRNGRWNFNQKKLVRPMNITRWTVVNFNGTIRVNILVNEMMKCGRMKGMEIDGPDVLNEDMKMCRETAHVRVDTMVDKMKERYPSGPPKFILCILRDRKNSDIYGPWKCRCLSEFGIVTQCVAGNPKIADQYVTNVLLKINTKLGGVNSLLQAEPLPDGPPLRPSEPPTIIFGMDVSHGPPGQAYIPSIAAVVGSRQWPLISRYRAEVRTQSPKNEMIEALFKPQGNKDLGIIRELMTEFYVSSNKRKPHRVIIFRDGVSESEFTQVINIELDQVIQACKMLNDSAPDPDWHPKFTVIVAQKNHHTKFFQRHAADNVPPGTVVDTGVCHPRNFDFYMCSQAGMIGTTRPTHYHVLYDENRFTADEMQGLVHSLSYVYQRSTTAISVVAPVYYAHLAAAQVGQFLKFEDPSAATSRRDGTVPGVVPGSGVVPELPTLHHNVRSSMFFC